VLQQHLREHRPRHLPISAKHSAAGRRDTI